MKRCIGLGILLIMTGCSAGESTKPEADPQENVQAESGAQAESEARTGSETQAGSEAETEPAVQLIGTGSEDDEFFVKCLQNLYQGNSITYADGYYYFRSQAENYSLCRTKGAGMPVEEVADQIPGSIYVREDQVYFINVSDGRTLYCVGTDGSGLRKLSDFPMQELIVLEDRIYFRSVYDREYDPFYQLTEAAAEDDRYLYSMNLDGSDCRLLIPRVCEEFMTDGERLYYLVYEAGGPILYQSGMDGEGEEEIFRKEDWIWDILLYQGDLYWVEDRKLVRLNAQGEEEDLAFGLQHFTIADGQAYVMNEEKIRTVGLTTGEERLLAERESASGNDGHTREEDFPWYSGSYYNRGIFLVNGQVFARYFESEEKGVLWHIWDGEVFAVFEDMEPLAAESLVLDTSLLHSGLDYYYPGETDEDAEKYLDTNGELHYEEAYGISEYGTAYGNFSITLPKFNSRLACYEQMNKQMEGLMELALEDKESFFQELSEYDQKYTPWYWREHGYGNLYVGEKYISMFYYRGGYEGGIRDWRNSIPLIFDRETGIMLHMDDLFTVEKSVYMKRLTGAVYKYGEMTGMDHYNEPFDNNVLVKNFGDLGCYLTADGIVLCYERYSIKDGASGCPTYEIPYEWFEDIF